MSNPSKEDEQLLQDASTLLMFANVAAKQQHNIHPVTTNPLQQQLPPQQPPQQQPPSLQLPALLLRPQPVPGKLLGKNLPNSLPENFGPQSQLQPSVHGHLLNAPVRNIQNLHQSIPQLHSIPPPIHHLIPNSLQPLASNPQSLPHINSLASYTNNLPNFSQYNVLSNYGGTNALNSPPIIHRNAPDSTLSLPGTTEDGSKPNTNTAAVNSDFPARVQANTATEMQSSNSANIPVSSHIKVESPPAKSPPQQRNRGSISLLMNNEAPAVENVLARAPHPISKQKSSSPPSAPVPVQQTHKRSLSHPENTGKLLFTSPGPANVTLERGINLKTGERNTSNAIVAAAALAAAAEIPFPLKVPQDYITPQTAPEAIIKPTPLEIVNTAESNTEETPSQAPTKQRKKRSPPAKKSNQVAKKPATAKKQTATQKKQADNQEIKLEPESKETHVQIAVTPSQTGQVTSKKEEETEIEDDENTEEEKEEMKRETFNIPPLESYKVGPDSGLIGCICSIEDDDGFTIQCDECFRWQHCHCMGFKTNEEVPEDEYKCYFCDKLKWGKLNAQVCQQNTLRRLNLEKAGKSTPSSKRKHSSSDKLEANTGNNTSDSSINSKKRKVSESSDRRDSNENALVAQQLVLPIKENNLLKDGVSAESYESVYYNLKENDYKKPEIKELLAQKGTLLYNEYVKADQQKKSINDIEIMTMQQYKAIKFSKIILPNYQKYMSENHKNVISKTKKYNKSTIKVKAYTDNQKQKFNGISKLALFISASDELTIPENTPIIEYLGEIDLFENYANDLVNQYATWGTTKPRVLKSSLKLSPELDIVLDSRFVGNEARFIRKSCPAAANCRIKQIYIPETNSFKFIVVTSKDIVLKSNEDDEELRLTWEWDPKHPILLLYDNNEKFELLPELNKAAVISYVDNILYFVECGCSTTNYNSSCALFKVKKATAYLLRSTRKASSISNINLTKSKEELIFSKKSKKFISWDDRLLERENIIELNLLVTAKDMDGSESSSAKIEAKGDENDKKSEKSKPSSLFKVPFKQQILARGQKLIGSKNTLDAMEVENVEIVTTSDDVVTLPFPIIPELASKIEHSIDETLKPIENEIEAKLTEREKVTEVSVEEAPIKVNTDVAAATISSNSTTEEIEKAANILASVEDTQEPKEEPEPVEVAPKIVKKLSFADYKKKMK